MNIQATVLTDVLIVETTAFSDHRGAFSRLYCEQELATVISGRRIVQINHSVTRKAGAVRGMHFQFPPDAEMKLVRCLKGRVFDVAVDLRAGSPTFLQWHGEELSPDNARMLVIPEGCAHGFQALDAGSELLYLDTAFYKSDAEGGLRYDDPRVRIVWPLPTAELSEKDSSHPWLSADFSGILLDS